jgi:ABC-type bacteriocin/lantibiotic exporter with double-glycine peptidase domain
LGYLTSIGVISFSCIHIGKIVHIFKHKQIEKHILYFENYQMFITILTSFAALFCLVSYGSWLFKLIVVPLLAIFITWNIIHTVKTVKKTPDLVERRL